MNIFLYVAICFVIELVWEFIILGKADRLRATGEEDRAEKYFIIGLVSIWVGPMIFMLLGFAIAIVAT